MNPDIPLRPEEESSSPSPTRTTVLTNSRTRPMHTTTGPRLRHRREIRRRRPQTSIASARRRHPAQLVKDQELITREFARRYSLAVANIKAVSKTWAEVYMRDRMPHHDRVIEATRRALSIMQPHGTVKQLLVSTTGRFKDAYHMLRMFPESGKKLDILGRLYRVGIKYYFVIRELELWLKIVMDNGRPSAPEFEAILQRYARRLQQVDEEATEHCQIVMEYLSDPNTRDCGDSDQVDVDLEHSTQQEETRQLEEELTTQMAELNVQFDQEDTFTGN